jgi:hypothetical protein
MGSCGTLAWPLRLLQPCLQYIGSIAAQWTQRCQSSQAETKVPQLDSVGWACGSQVSVSLRQGVNGDQKVAADEWAAKYICN